MRLIDADELKALYEGLEDDLHMSVRVVKANIDDMPTIEAEPLVRCKDCKHFAHDSMAVIHDTGYYCTRPNQQSCNLVPEDYCSYGERKDGGENG